MMEKHVLTLSDVYEAIDDPEFIWQVSREPFTGPNFILPDGRFIGHNDDGESFHADIINYFIDRQLIAEEDLNIGPNGEDFYFLARLGIIKCSAADSNQYIQLNINIRPTTKQYDSLESFLYFILESSDEVKIIVQVFAPDSGSGKYNKYYDLQEDLPEEVIKKIKRYYTTGYLVEGYEQITKQLLLEATRTQLIDKSKHADNYVPSNQANGKNRYERRLKSHIATQVSDYNEIDMDTFWKKDQLSFGVKVQGETNNYVVKVKFLNAVREMAEGLKRNNNKLEFKIILQALTKCFNSGNVFVSCSCPDWLYSGNAYWSTVGGYNSGQPQTNNGKSIVNPHDTKGAGCKHILLVLSNLHWVLKIASVINNYIYYCKDNMENNYGSYIFPKLYGMPYDKAIQMTLQDYDATGAIDNNIKSDIDTINLANAIGRRRTQYKRAPEVSVNPRYIAPKTNTTIKQDKNTIPFNFEEPEKEVVPTK